MKHLLLPTIAAVVLAGCGSEMEKALRADTTEESSSDLIALYENAEPSIKKLAKTASDVLDRGDYVLAIRSVNQLFANAAKLNANQFMVASETMVNIQKALIEAAEDGDKKAQWLLSTMVDIRRG
jgi:hypothetical protein